MKLTVGVKIGAGYALALLVLAAFGILSYRNATGYVEAIGRRVSDYQLIDSLQGVMSAMQDTETGQRGYLIVGEDRYLEPYRSGIAAVDKYLSKLRSLTEANTDQQRELDALEPLVAAKLDELKETIELRKSKGFDAALKVVQTDRGKQIMDDIRKIVGQMSGRVRMSVAQLDDEISARSRMSIYGIVYGIPVAAITLSLLGLLVTRTITHQLRESIAQLSSSAAEILATTTQLASSAMETATAVSETTATVEQVKQTAQLTNQKARYVSDSAQKAANVSTVGRTAVGDAVQGMHRIQEQMESVADSIVRLSEQGQAIGEIIATVNGLAEQSNLLAVNAAIEATKAGEQGKGFGVVAQEIKSLAEQSKQATAQVRTILGDIQKATSTAVLATEQSNKAVDAGVKQTGETGESIRLLADSIGEAAQAATQIAASSQQQMVGMDQVVVAMESIKLASTQNVAGTRQAETAAQDLHTLGQRLGDLIGSRSA
ncbi:CHASE3 domain-containing protein [Dyella subtropica]|uniref:CHASE3 domain-containing protein n=1 Tax=Dyella subtropica TaxID=2992127 RepID=UPI00224DC9D1|nr:CHASE3 domain-containing protein [Dyella subtropica]